jgi:hypothetical protein
MPQMTKAQRACQIWSLLVLAAKYRHILTYDIVEKCIGVPQYAVGRLLAPIQTYCAANQLPALTSLVVTDDGLPGPGFTAAADVPGAQAQVFRYNWFELKTPTTGDFEPATTQGATV